MRHIIAILRGRKGVRWRDSICCEEWLLVVTVRGGGERAAAAAAAWSACSIFVSVVCTRKGRLCIEPSLQARQSKGAERPTRLELQGPGAPPAAISTRLVRSDGPRNLFQRQPATR